MVFERAWRDIWQGEAADGAERLDTRVTGGEPDKGCGLFFNGNPLDDGAHTVVAYMDGEEFGRGRGAAAVIPTRRATAPVGPGQLAGRPHASGISDVSGNEWWIPYASPPRPSRARFGLPPPRPRLGSPPG